MATAAILPFWIGIAGLIIALPAGIAILAGAWALFRGGGGTAIASLEATNRVLERRVHDLEEQGREKDKMIAELKGRTDVTLAIKPALSPLLDWTTAHESRAQDRHEAMLTVLDLIAQRLGPDAS